jgi:hypothetical protein
MAVMMRRRKKRVMVVMRVMMRRRTVRVRRLLRKRKSPVIRGWNTTQGQLYPPSKYQVHPLIRAGGKRITSKPSTMPLN